MGRGEVSLHTYRAMQKARGKGAAAGMPAHEWLWKLSKRELVEVALRLADRLSGDGNSLQNGYAQEIVKTELDALKANKIL